jgi:hypothetical protein|tara:strand:+ start:55 stop:186 length:132 start_codon:yes stop_codon:yes gene_type:complete
MNEKEIKARFFVVNKLNLNFNTHIMTYKDPEMEEKYGTIFLFI